MENHNLYREQRLEKLKKLWEKGENPFKTAIYPKNLAHEIFTKYESFSSEQLENEKEIFSIAGRIMAIRSFGKAAFLTLKDRSGSFQVFIQKTSVSEETFEAFKSWDIGDFIFVEGNLFRTKTQELTLKVLNCELIVKTLRTLPEKWHGLTDVETRYRQRYLDLISNSEVAQTFIMRSKMVQKIRSFFVERDFLEVETPMMQPIPGGATARPFITHHHALDRKLYLRIAPELYLKRLVVGGIERVFELNRNFRNEGISIQHNPEFTMIEFYQSYATYRDLMILTEELLAKLVLEFHKGTTLEYQGQILNFKRPFRSLKLMDSLIEIGNLPVEILSSKEAATKIAESLQIKFKDPDIDHLEILTEIFEKIVEPKLIDPTFITHYPIVVSPLSRRSEEDPRFAERFELFIYGREIANGFSELNDPIDQHERFLSQVASRERGNEESMHLDEDFIRALEYGMPPTAGEGIGIDRLAMLLTNQASIREVILFPQLKKET